MTPTVLIAIAAAVIIGVLAYLVRRSANQGRQFDLGVVSTRWLSELRRDEPWSRS